MIELDLTEQEVQLVINALGNLPYGQVEAIIQNIRNQAIPQLAMMNQEQPKLPDNEAA